MGGLFRMTTPLVVVFIALAICPWAFAGGSFQSSDQTLNTVWQESVATANDMVIGGPLEVDSDNRACEIDLPSLISDGLVRDRCPYSGDLAVTGATMLVSTPSTFPLIRTMIQWFAGQQQSDGGIQGSPESGGLNIFDYNGYWVECLYEYTLYTGDLSLAQNLWPTMLRLMDGWYPAQTQGLLLSNNGVGSTYNYMMDGRQPINSYFNAQYALTLKYAAKLAGWTSHGLDGQRWLARKTALAAPYNQAFWDAAAGAYMDSPTGDIAHPEDGNSFAILADLASQSQALSALDFMSTKNYMTCGNSMSDVAMNHEHTNQTVFPFITYREVLARFQMGQDASAIELIDREWGFIAAKSLVDRMWEWTGANCSRGPLVSSPSFDHGWSSGAAPALTNYVLGVVPTSPGFKTFTVVPHTGGLAWAKGAVPSPGGDINVSWSWGIKCVNVMVKNPKNPKKPPIKTQKCGRDVVVSVTAPLGEKWTEVKALAKEST